MARILCVEDSPEFFIYLNSILRDHSVTHAQDLRQALQFTQNGTHSFDLILLDISLPDGNGLKMLPRLREAPGKDAIPIIVLSSDSDSITKVAAFGVGADDYVAKPPDPNELKARIEARLRQNQTAERTKAQINFGDLLIDSNTMRVEHHSPEKGIEMVELTPSEFKILKLLCGRAGQVYSRGQLIDHVWGVGKHVTPRTVDAHVSNLRKKLSESQVKVETVTGTGYRAIVKGELKDPGN